MTSRQIAGQSIRGRLGSALIGLVVCAAPNLGADDSVGKPLRHKGLGAKAKKRCAGARARAGRTKKLSRTLGRKYMNIWVAGPLPAAAHAPEVHGISDGELLRLKRSFAS
eukprot:5515056-Pyramimonas_sp.AAC.1